MSKITIQGTGKPKDGFCKCPPPFDGIMFGDLDGLMTHSTCGKLIEDKEAAEQVSEWKDMRGSMVFEIGYKVCKCGHPRDDGHDMLGICQTVTSKKTKTRTVIEVCRCDKFVLKSVKGKK